MFYNHARNAQDLTAGRITTYKNARRRGNVWRNNVPKRSEHFI